MDKKTYDAVDNPLKKACADPERYYKEMMAIIDAGGVIPYQNYFAFTTTPVIELIQKAPEADKVRLAAYLFKNNHNDLEVQNITELPINQVSAIGKAKG